MSREFSSLHLKSANVTASGKPRLEDDEFNIFMKDDIGLYQDNYKLEKFQSGRIYLTNKRIVFINNLYTAMNISMNLKYVERIELSNRFLKSSPKITIYLSDISNINNEKVLQSERKILITWMCPICTCLNELFISMNHLKKMKASHDNLPTCHTCGVQASLETIENSINQKFLEGDKQIDLVSSEGVECLNCTFNNHPSLINCEICGAALINRSNSQSYMLTQSNGINSVLNLSTLTVHRNLNLNILKLSFRSGGQQEFYQYLLETLDKSAVLDTENELVDNQKDQLLVSNGIHGLANISLKKNHEDSLLLGKSIQDLDQLLSKANELISLSRKYQNILIKQKTNEQEIDANLELLINSKQSVENLNVLLKNNQIQKSLTNSKNISALNLLKSGKSYTVNSSHFNNSYIDELARSIYDFLVDQNMLDAKIGLITIYDLFLLYNKSRQINLIKPEELFQAVQRFEALKFGVVVTKIGLSDSTNANMRDEDSSHIYAISKKNNNYTMKILEYISENPGLSTQQLQIKLQMNNFILKHILNNLIESSDVVIDSSVRGFTYWKNEILNQKSDSASKPKIHTSTSKLDKTEMETVSKVIPYISSGDIKSKRYEDLKSLNFN
jgi:ESCRT-II complex subunit VPS36